MHQTLRGGVRFPQAQREKELWVWLRAQQVQQAMRGAMRSRAL